MILKKFGLYDCNPSSTPGDTLVILRKDNGNNEEAQKNIPYCKAVSSLMYLMLCTRPDIVNPMIKLVQYTSNFNNVHSTVVKHVFQYLKGSNDNVCTLGNVEKVNERNMTLSGACDSNWVEDLDDRQSTSGYIFMINSGMISWQTKKQQMVAISTMQAEYQALSGAVKEALWI